MKNIVCFIVFLLSMVSANAQSNSNSDDLPFFAKLFLIVFVITVLASPFIFFFAILNYILRAIKIRKVKKLYAEGNYYEIVNKYYFLKWKGVLNLIEDSRTKLIEQNKSLYDKNKLYIGHSLAGNTEVKHMPDFTAIDFETANSEPSSVCALGLAKYENGLRVFEKSWLIKPVPDKFSPFNISIHNITPKDVETSPNFQGIWNEVKPYLENSLVIAHNMSFDLKCLQAVSKVYNLELPKFETACTLNLSRTKLSLDDNKLPTVAKHFGIPLNHHQALSDAIACAEIFLAITTNKQVPKVQEIPKYVEPVVKNIDKANPFYGKRVVFTGTLKSLDRDMAEHYVILNGGETTRSMSKKVDYLVEGRQDSYKVNNGSSTKQDKAQALKEAGHHIQIINEKQFLNMVEIAKKMS